MSRTELRSELRARKRLAGAPDLREVAMRRPRRTCFWTWPFGHRWEDPRYHNGVKRQNCAACGCERDTSWDEVF